MDHSIVEMTKALAWPIVALRVAYLFRPELRGLLERLTDLKYGSAEAKFRSGLESTEAHAEKVQLESVAPPTAEILSAEEQLQRIAETSPRAAILEAWVGIEDALNQAISPGGNHKPARSYILFLGNKGEFDSNLKQFVTELRNLRNEVAHNSGLSISTAQALVYIKSAALAISQIQVRSKKG